MKNYHVVGIIVSSALIVACATSFKDELPLEDCPVPTQYNTGFVVTDEDHNGEADTAWQVYNSGPCAGLLTDPESGGTPTNK